MRNYCVSLVKKNKKNNYSNLNTKDITDNKKFWKTVKPMFTDKVKHTENITLINNDTIISDKQSIAKMFNNFFINAVPNINIKINDKTITNTGNISDLVLKAIKKYEKHPSILKIKNITKTKETFSFLNITEKDISVIVKNLNTSKATTHKNIPIKIFKEHITVYINPIPTGGGGGGAQCAPPCWFSFNNFFIYNPIAMKFWEFSLNFIWNRIPNFFFSKLRPYLEH